MKPTCPVLSIFTPDREFAETVARNNLNGLGNPLKVYRYDTPEHGEKWAIRVSSLRSAFIAMRAGLSPTVCPKHLKLFRLARDIRALNHAINHAGWGGHARSASLQAERNALLEEARKQIAIARDTCPVRKAARAKDGRGS